MLSFCLRGVTLELDLIGKNREFLKIFNNSTNTGKYLEMLTIQIYLLLSMEKGLRLALNPLSLSTKTMNRFF
jgi:hypothetical protein